MTLQDFRKLYDAEPFQPFTLHLANGKEISVLHPDFVAVPSAGRTVVVITPDNSRMHMVDLLLVSSLETQTHASGELPSAPSSPNGGTRE